MPSNPECAVKGHRFEPEESIQVCWRPGCDEGQEAIDDICAIEEANCVCETGRCFYHQLEPSMWTVWNEGR